MSPYMKYLPSTYIPQTKRLRACKIGFRASVALRAAFRAPARIWLAVIDFQKVDLGQIGSEEIVYSRFIKIPLG